MKSQFWEENMKLWDRKSELQEEKKLRIMTFKVAISFYLFIFIQWQKNNN